MWLMLGLQLSGSPRGPDEEEDGRPRHAESTEPGGLQHRGRKLGLRRRLHHKVLQLHHEERRRRLRGVLPLRTPGRLQNNGTNTPLKFTALISCFFLFAGREMSLFCRRQGCLLLQLPHPSSGR